MFGFKSLLPSLTVQSGKADADINTLVKRFGLDGPFPQNIRMPMAEGFYDITDFRSAQAVIRESTESFSLLPADVRARFQNDPAVFVDFATDVDGDGKLVNLEEMRKMGLAIPKKEDTIVPVPVNPPA